MSEFDLKAMIKATGGEIIEPSSLNNEANENKVEQVFTPTSETTTTEKVEATPVSEMTSAATEVKEEVVAPVTETKEEVVQTPVAEVKTEPEPEVEKTKGWDIIQDIDKQFKEMNGLSIMEAREIVDTDFAAMEETDLIEEFLILQDPQITDMEIRAELLPYDILFESVADQEKAIEEGRYTREQIQILNAKFEGWKRKALSSLNNVKNEVSAKLENFQIAGKNKNSEVEARNTLINESKNFLSTYSTEKIEIKDGDKVLETIEYNVNDADKKLLSDIAADPSTVYKLWLNENGLDVAKMMRDINSLVGRDKMNKLIYNQGLAKGASKEVKDISNINFEATQQPTTQKTIIPDGMQKLINHAMGI